MGRSIESTGTIRRCSDGRSLGVSNGIHWFQFLMALRAIVISGRDFFWEGVWVILHPRMVGPPMVSPKWMSYSWTDDKLLSMPAINILIFSVHWRGVVVDLVSWRDSRSNLSVLEGGVTKIGTEASSLSVNRSSFIEESFNLALILSDRRRCLTSFSDLVFFLIQ